MGCQPSVAGVREELGAPAYDVPQDSDSDSVGSPRTFCVTLQGGPGSLLGATLADWTGEVDGAVVAQVSQGGLLHEWNRRSPDNAVEKGDVIVQVNGATGYWNIISQIKTWALWKLPCKRQPWKKDRRARRPASIRIWWRHEVPMALGPC